jgi:hypothetical protein
MYDYLLTLGDEVLPCGFSIEMSGFDRPADTLRLVWEEVLG